MAVYAIELDGRKFQVEAPDKDTAWEIAEQKVAETPGQTPEMSEQGEAESVRDDYRDPRVMGSVSPEFDENGLARPAGILKQLDAAAAQTTLDAGKALYNSPGAFVNMVKSIPAAVGAAVGAVRESKGVGDLAGKAGNTLRAVGEQYKRRYFSGPEALRRAIIEDLPGVAADVSTVAGVGGGLAGLAAKGVRTAAPAVSSGLSQAAGAARGFSRAVDPMTQAFRGAGAAMKAAGRVKLAPFGKSVDKAAIAAAEATGVKLPVSAVSKNHFVQGLEALGAKGFFGGKVSRKIEAANQALRNYADDIVKNSPTLSEAGAEIADAFNRYKDKFIRIKNKLYERASLPEVGESGEILRPGVFVNPGKSVGFAREILEKKTSAAGVLGKAEDLDIFKSVVDKLSKWPVAAGVIKATIDELDEIIGSSAQPFAMKTKGALMKLSASLRDELDEAIKVQRPDIAKHLETANKFYNDGRIRLNSSYGKAIKKFADAKQFDQIIPAVVKPGMSVDDVPRILGVVGKKNVPLLQKAVVRDILGSAGSVTGEVAFKPAGVAQAIKRWKPETLKALLPPGLYKKVMDVKTVSEALGRGSRITQGSQTAFLTKIAELSKGVGSAVGGFAAAQGNIYPLGFLVGGDYLLNKAVSSPAGMNLLTTGVRPFSGAGRLAGVVGKSGWPMGRASRIEAALQEQQRE
jgi:hypothetical protein